MLQLLKTLQRNKNQSSLQSSDFKKAQHIIRSTMQKMGGKQNYRLESNPTKLHDAKMVRGRDLATTECGNHPSNAKHDRIIFNFSLSKFSPATKVTPWSAGQFKI